jgi:hypothetical protein
MKWNLPALALGLTAIVAVPAFADDDRPPTAEERTKVEAALKAEGFTGWKEIEFDDNRWEIDDAIHSDGKVYDVYLRQDLTVAFKELD